MELLQLGRHHSRRTATVILSAIATTMSSEEYMNEPVAPDDAAASEGERTPALDAASQHAGAKSGAKEAGD
jgi:hypothetical protein